MVRHCVKTGVHGFRPARAAVDRFDPLIPRRPGRQDGAQLSITTRYYNANMLGCPRSEQTIEGMFQQSTTRTADERLRNAAAKALTGSRGNNDDTNA